MKNAYNRAFSNVIEAAMVNVQYAKMSGNQDSLNAAVDQYAWLHDDGLSEVSGSLILWMAHADAPFITILCARASQLMECLDMHPAEAMCKVWAGFENTLPEGFQDLGGSTAEI